jgi:hypothetical protein
MRRMLSTESVTSLPIAVEHVSSDPEGQTTPTAQAVHCPTSCRYGSMHVSAPAGHATPMAHDVMLTTTTIASLMQRQSGHDTTTASCTVFNNDSTKVKLQPETIVPHTFSRTGAMSTGSSDWNIKPIELDTSGEQSSCGHSEAIRSVMAFAVSRHC